MVSSCVIPTMYRIAGLFRGKNDVINEYYIAYVYCEILIRKRLMPAILEKFHPQHKHAIRYVISVQVSTLVNSQPNTQTDTKTHKCWNVDLPCTCYRYQAVFLTQILLLNVNTRWSPIQIQRPRKSTSPIRMHDPRPMAPGMPCQTDHGYSRQIW